MVASLRQADGRELRGGALMRVGDAGKLERHGHVLQRRHGRDEMEGLEHDADITAAKPRQRILVERAKRLRLRP